MGGRGVLAVAYFLHSGSAPLFALFSTKGVYALNACMLNKQLNFIGRHRYHHQPRRCCSLADMYVIVIISAQRKIANFLFFFFYSIKSFSLPALTDHLMKRYRIVSTKLKNDSFLICSVLV